MGIIFLPIKLVKLALNLVVVPLKAVGPTLRVVIMIPLLPFKALSSLISAVSGSRRKGRGA